MAAPAGVCVSCGEDLQWTMHRGLLYVRCRYCIDLFGTELAGDGVRERREAVTPDLSVVEDLPF